MREIADLIVVGAGIVGAQVAVLARIHRPEWQIQLIDRTLVGHGATAYSAGLMPLVGQTAASRERAARARRGYVRLRASGIDLPEVRTPACWVISGARRAALEESCGGPLAPVALDRHPMPWLSRDEIALDGGLVSRLDAPAALRGLVRWARDRSIEVHEGVAVHRITGGPIWTLESSDGVTRSARRLVLALGPWLVLERLWQPEGPLEQVRTKKVVALHVEPGPAPAARLVLFPDDDAFLSPEPERGRWLLGVPCQTWDWRPEDRSLSPDEVELARSILASRFPHWSVRVSGASVFGDAYTPDREPIVQRLAETVVRVGGCSGSGVRLAPALAEEALALLP